MPKIKLPKNKFLRILTILVGAGVLVFLAASSFFLYCNWVVSSCDDRCFDNVSQLPTCHYALVLGTAKKTPWGEDNFFYQGRIDAAAKLYFTGKVQKLIVSGDNSRKTYDETSDMKNDLISRGVPESAIVCDYAGFRTLDSVYRAKNRLGCTELIIVTQKFHCARAIYLAEKIGISATGFAAPGPDPVKFNWLIRRNHFRESFARCKAWLDVNILNRQPKYAK